MKTDFFWKGFMFYFTILAAITMIAVTCLLIPELCSGNQGAYWLLGFNLLAIAAVAFVHYVEFVDHSVYDTSSVKHITGYYYICQLLRHIPYFRKKRVKYYHDMRLVVGLLQETFKRAKDKDIFYQSVLKEIGN